MEETGFFPEEQHRYRARRSTTTALLSIQDVILRYMENNIDTCVVFSDLSNAFDTLPHETILAKLRVYGFTESSINWYRSYLAERAQFIFLRGAKSETKRTIRGLPQTSLNGSIIFSIVFWDVVIVQVIKNVFMIIYADDLSIKMRPCGNVKVDKILINKQMAAIQSWMNSNQLVFNSMKTELLEDIVQHHLDLYQRLVNAEADPKKKKKILKEHFLAIDLKRKLLVKMG